MTPHIFYHLSSKLALKVVHPRFRCLSSGIILYKKEKNVKNQGSKTTKERKHHLNEDHEVTLLADNCFRNAQNDSLSEDKSRIVHKLRTNVSQIFGFNLNVLNKRFEAIRESGLSKSDAMLLVLSIPACFEICNPNFFRVVKCFKKYDLPVLTLLRTNPFLGSIDSACLEENLKLLDEKGLKSNLLNAILRNPTLLCYPLTSEALNNLKSLHSLGLDQNKLLEASLYDPKLYSVEDNSLKDILDNVTSINLSDVSEFLASYNIELERIYWLYPEFLFSSKEKLEACLDKVLSSPFFLDADNIEKLLRTRPDVFLSLSDEKVTKLIKYIEKISTVKSRAFRLLTERPEIFRYPEKFNRRCDLFKSYGFNEADIARLLAVKGGPYCLVDCDDFSHDSMTEILDFYMSSKDLSPVQLVVSAPICFAKTHFPVIKQRFTYMRHIGMMKIIAPRKVNSIKGKPTLQSIIKCEREEFVKICQRTMEEYDRFCRGFKYP